jgi:hypothetical protein
LRRQLASGGVGINPTSKLMLTIPAGVATWEREIMLERQREGIAKAKAAGKYKGRPVCRLPRGRGAIEQFAAAAGNFSICRAWYRLPGPDATAGVDLMFTSSAVVVGILAINLPFVILTLQAVIEGIDVRLEEAPQGLGAAPGRAFWRMVWPLALPGC